MGVEEVMLGGRAAHNLFHNRRFVVDSGFGDYEMGDDQYRNYEMGNDQYRKCHHFFQDCRIVACISQCGLRGGWFLGRFWEKGLVFH
jgi:hypothetical protein